ncbi:MAG: hypothetical protein JWQ28_501 [Pedobacter sp.]|jgi:hypothetical protein|nr:hypothetical protein [Pedobacter sp.]
MSSGKYRAEHNCLNCGHHVEEHFCTHCGQENIEVREDAFHMISHAVADYFHFESKFFATIRPLLVKPGNLTKEYVSGKRVSFIHPIRLYIFISILFFIVTLSGRNGGVNNDEKVQSPRPQVERDSVAMAEAAQIREAMTSVPISQTMKDSIVRAAVTQMKMDRTEKERKTSFQINKKWFVPSDTTVASYEKRQKLLPSAKRDNFLKHYIIRRNLELQKYPDAEKKMTEEIMHNIPKMMFILLPLFALILKVVYFNKKKYYYEHLIYSFHVHSAIFLSYLILVLLQHFFNLFYNLDGWLGFFWSVYILWYIYRSLKTFYGSRRWVTIFKIFFLMFCYTIVFAISTVTVIALTVILL